MSLLKLISQIGLDADLPKWKSSKLESLNKSTLISAILYFPFIFIFWTNGYQPLAYVTIAVVTVKALHYVMMKLEWYNATRLIQSTFGASLFVMIVHIMVRDTNEYPLLSLLVLQIALSFVALAVFDNREKSLFYLANVTNFVSLIIVVFIPGQNVWDFTSEIFREGSVYYIIMVIALVYLAGYTHRISKVFWEVNDEQQQIIDKMKVEQQTAEENTHKLNEYVKQVEEARQEDEKRQWVAQGNNAIDKILRANRDTEQVLDLLIAEIVSYSKSNQGGLFILNDEKEQDKHLNLEACYAYNRKKFIEKRVEIGQGLLGQCYLEAETTMFTEIPDNYVRITSGLGDAAPRCLILIPLIDNEKVHGVLELAAFNKYEPHVIKYLEEVAGSIASYIINIKISTKTTQLLEASEGQAEQLRSQEEEMRQNMEEMQATQEEVHRLKKQDEEKLKQAIAEKEALQRRVKELENQLETN